MAPLFTFILPLTTFILGAKAECYYPNGDVSTVDWKCGTGTNLCCGLNWQCLTNGLCQDSTNATDLRLDRRTCADKTFQDKACLQFCKYSDSGNERIRSCGGGKYCCAGNGDLNCCDGELPHGTEIFDLEDEKIFASIAPPDGSAIQ